MLGPDQFEQFSAAYVRHINDSCKYTSVATIYHTCGNTMQLIDKMVQSGVDAISLDAAAAGVDLPTVASALPPDVIVMGNINPIGALLHDSPEAVVETVEELLTDRREKVVLADQVHNARRPKSGDCAGASGCAQDCTGDQHCRELSYY